MSSPFIFVTQINSVQIIRLNRPEELNALSREMIRELSDLFTNLNSQPDLRAIILTGTGDNAFRAGIDSTGADDAQALEVSELSQALCNQIENCRVPVIGAVSGIASGVGCELALACHLRIASDNAEFSLSETGLGSISGIGSTQRFARAIGEGRALEMMLTGGTVGAEEALRFGLINRVARAGELLAEAERLAHEIAQLAPLAIRACLEAVTRGTQMSLEDGLALESQLFARLFATDDVREGTSAFLEKRVPVFKGT
jgi:enoyl-CoA hydratase